MNGRLYGTTSGGGANTCYPGGCGAVFSVDPETGAETVLYSFCAQPNCADGGGPRTNLVHEKGTLYGTAGGGANGEGVVFALDIKTGVESVLYSFCSQLDCADGASPYAGLVDVNGTLYGTTYYGGAHNRGTVFSLTNF